MPPAAPLSSAGLVGALGLKRAALDTADGSIVTMSAGSDALPPLRVKWVPTAAGLALQLTSLKSHANLRLLPTETVVDFEGKSWPPARWVPVALEDGAIALANLAS
eukprot:5252633-Prymnesium_polylepis.1